MQGMTAGLPLLFWGDLGLFLYLNIEHFKEIRKQFCFTADPTPLSWQTTLRSLWDPGCRAATL